MDFMYLVITCMPGESYRRWLRSLLLCSYALKHCLQYTDLMKKRKIVLNDKAKIQAVIDELDKKKNEALKKAWEQVNKVSLLQQQSIPNSQHCCRL